MSSSFRNRVEKVSAPFLIRLHTAPRFVLPVLLLGFMLCGLITSGVTSGVLLLLVAFFVGWLLYLSWPLLDGRARLLRTLTVLLIVLAAVSRLASS